MNASTRDQILSYSIFLLSAVIAFALTMALMFAVSVVIGLF